MSEYSKEKRRLLQTLGLLRSDLEGRVEEHTYALETTAMEVDAVKAAYDFILKEMD